MKRILCIAVVCIMVIVFMSASDVSALSLEKIQNTDWDTKMVSKRYNEATGQYLSSGVGQGITNITSGNVYSDIALFVDRDVGMYGIILITLNSYTFYETTNKLKSILSDITYYRSDGSVYYSHSGDCTAKITFTTNQIFEGTITFTDAGTKYIITLKGKKLGNYIGD